MDKYYIVHTESLAILEGPFDSWGDAKDRINSNYRAHDAEGLVDVMTISEIGER
jgi:hypothetical protein